MRIFYKIIGFYRDEPKNNNQNSKIRSQTSTKQKHSITDQQIDPLSSRIQTWGNNNYDHDYSNENSTRQPVNIYEELANVIKSRYKADIIPRPQGNSKNRHNAKNISSHIYKQKLNTYF